MNVLHVLLRACTHWCSPGSRSALTPDASTSIILRRMTCRVTTHAILGLCPLRPPIQVNDWSTTLQMLNYFVCNTSSEILKKSPVLFIINPLS